MRRNQYRNANGQFTRRPQTGGNKYREEVKALLLRNDVRLIIDNSNDTLDVYDNNGNRLARFNKRKKALGRGGSGQVFAYNDGRNHTIAVKSMDVDDESVFIAWALQNGVMKNCGIIPGRVCENASTTDTKTYIAMIEVDTTLDNFINIRPAFLTLRNIVKLVNILRRYIECIMNTQGGVQYPYLDIKEANILVNLNKRGRIKDVYFGDIGSMTEKSKIKIVSNGHHEILVGDRTAEMICPGFSRGTNFLRVGADKGTRERCVSYLLAVFLLKLVYRSGVAVDVGQFMKHLTFNNFNRLPLGDDRRNATLRQNRTSQTQTQMRSQFNVLTHLTRWLQFMKTDKDAFLYGQDRLNDYLVRALTPRSVAADGQVHGTNRPLLNEEIPFEKDLFC